MGLLMLFLLTVLAWWLVARFLLDGEDLSRYDLPASAPINDAPSQDNDRVLAEVKEFARSASTVRGRDRLRHLREAMDRMGDDADLSGVNITAVSVAGRPAEWVTTPANVDGRRLLYIHGGAFTMGSPRSHRTITTEIARRTGLAVLALDYRLMPENSRRAGIDDCRAAYQWLLEHGPNGPGPADSVFVAGDSAGGNLTLSLIAWLRDQCVRKQLPGRQVDGAIALSPLTDATLASPSIHGNVDDDPMLGPMAKMITRLPRPLMLWLTFLQNRIRPTDPLISPLRGDLSGLPPVLVQASEAEILADDARRYVNKARAAGSPAELETWHGMVHVWQAFGVGLPESDQAFERIAAFVRRVEESRGRADAA